VLHSLLSTALFPYRRSSDLKVPNGHCSRVDMIRRALHFRLHGAIISPLNWVLNGYGTDRGAILATQSHEQVHRHNRSTVVVADRSEEHTSELQSRENLVCRL